MGWVHRHRWVEHARTFAEPRMVTGIAYWGATDRDRLLNGYTTFVFRCADEECGAVKVVEAIGRVKE